MKRDASPKRMNPVRYNGKKVTYFTSSAVKPFNQLSNFNRAPIELFKAPESLIKVNSHLDDWLKELGGAAWPSSEHLWKSLQAQDLSTFKWFVNGGRWTDLTAEAFEPFVKSVGEAVGKVAYWSAKENVGVLPKMGTNPRHAKRVGGKFGFEKEDLGADLEREVWIDILTLKFQQNDEHRRILLSTGDDYLVEFDRGAKRGCHWGGWVDDGKLWGGNAMGEYMMAVREKIKA